MPTQVKPALIEAKWMIWVLVGVIGGMLASFVFVGCINETQETNRMKACVSKNMEWTHRECTFKTDRMGNVQD